MCGLFGFSGWDKANIAKLKILGLYNKTRGRDSCGYYFNEKLVKGTYLKKEWDSFIEEEIISDKGKSNLFIGHTRASTVGANTEENAHPFNVDDKLIIAHNGTLDNHWPLCNKYGVDHTKIHVDSLALGNLLVKQGFKVLEEYRGYAALLLHNLAEPDSLMIYHGASRVFESDEKLTEERPLFYMSSREGVYVSSLKSSLMAIRDSASEVPETVPHNRIIKITKGKLAKGYTVINRGNTNVGLEKKTVTPYYSKPPQTSYATPSVVKHPSPPPVIHATSKNTQEGGSNSTTNYSAASNNGMGSAVLPSIADFPIGKDIRMETKPPRCFDPQYDAFNIIYSQRGRYYEIEDNKLAHGTFFLDKDGVIYPEKMDKVKPFYFFRGVMIQDEQKWLEIEHHMNTNSAIGTALKHHRAYDFAKHASAFSRYPVCNIEEEGAFLAESVKRTWWKGIKPANGSTQPLFTTRNYVFELGVLKKIESENKKDQIFMVGGMNEWVNQNMFKTPAPDVEKMEFENGEKIMKDHPTLKTLVRHVDIPYKSADQVLADCPSTVINALALYIADSLKNGDNIASQQEVGEATAQFIDIAVKDNVTFRENMEEFSKPIEYYIKQAYMEELHEDYEESKSVARMITEAPKMVGTNEVKTSDVEYGSCDIKKKGQTEEEKKEVIGDLSVPFTDYEIIDGQTNPDLTSLCYLTKNPNGTFSIKNKKEEGKVVQMKLSLNNPVDKFIRETIEVNQELESIKQVQQLITYLRFLFNKAKNLRALDKSKFAQDVSFRMADLANTFRDDLCTAIEEHNKEELYDAIKPFKAY